MRRSYLYSKLVISCLYFFGLFNCITSYAQISTNTNQPASNPLFAATSVPPLTMLVVGRDHSLFFEAYNDASDLDGDGELEIRFKPNLTYYGLFDSSICYTYSGGETNNGLFSPFSSTSAANYYKCDGKHWSGNWLNYITTSRIDALRKVLYGGYRESDTTTETILRRTYIPQDGHVWAKEYTSESVDKYKISDYTQISAPTNGRRHFFGNATMGSSTNCATLDNCSNLPPLLSVVQNSSKRVWDWASSEKPTLNNSTHSGTRTNYTVRVKVCTTDFNGGCKKYPNGTYKPIGLLHDYGEDNLMKFGLLTGSYNKNMSGGVLRKTVSSFSSEINSQTGQINDSAPIISTLDNLRIRDYNNGRTDSNYRNGSYRTGIMQQGAYVDWGNPIGEMMYESLRYFAGKGSYTPDFYTSGSHDAAVGLSPANWDNPYSTTSSDQKYWCAKPNMLVMSNTNVSYDSDQVPGTAFGSFSGDLSGLNVQTEAQKITDLEPDIKGLKFIGAVGTNEDYAPTAKTVTTLGNIRGLSPEEPTKQGSYYAASIARFGSTTDLNPVTGDQNTNTYVVALASPLPKLEFNVGGNVISLVPFAKTIDGSSTDRTKGKYQPTDPIVDLYIEEYSTTRTKFRVNFEADEQGNDFDSDVIVEYDITVNSDNTLTVKVTPTAESTGSNQNLGYVISGTDRDGTYLVVQDKKESLSYFLNVPPTRNAGYCDSSKITNSECTQLPWINGTGTINGASASTSTQTFKPSDTIDTATTLKNPLWYAAKYGIAGRDTSKITGDPDNYFLVTNASTLKEQLSQVLSNILQSNNSVTAPAVTPTTNSSTNYNFSVYSTTYDIDTWSGDLIKQNIDASSSSSSNTITASSKLPSSANRNVKFGAIENEKATLKFFQWSQLSDQQKTELNLNPVPDSNSNYSSDNLGEQRVSFIRGATNNSFRTRETLIGDIINSSPILVDKAQYLTYLANKIESSSDYGAFATEISDRTPMVYVGANDGMLHGFNANTLEEKFAFIPSSLIPKLNKLTDPDYAPDKHQYYVDGTPVVRDVVIDGKWHTVLVGTLGAGGQSIFALDITDPDDIKLLWELNKGNDVTEEDETSDLGYSFPAPTLAKLSTGQWAVITGNGYASETGKAALLIIDISTGALLKKITVDDGIDNGLSTIKVADDNNDGIADYVYAGDLKGNLWRIDLKGDTLNKFEVAFGGSPLFTAKDSNGKVQPITSPPSLIRHPSREGYLVIVGTGAYFRNNDISDTTSVQTLYGIWDKQTSSSTTPNLSRTNLQEQTINEQHQDATFSDGSTEEVTRTIRLISENTIDWDTKYGWYLDLKLKNETHGDGERIVDSMSIVGQALFFNTRTPSDDPCSAGLTGWIYGVNPYTGGRTRFNIFDLNSNYIIDSRDAYNSAVVSSFQMPAGGFTLSGSNLFGTDGSVIQVNYGPHATGRQSWQALPEDN